VPAGFAPEAKALIGVKNSILDFIQGKNQVLSTTGVHWPGARPGPIALGERREVYTPEIRGVLGKRNAVHVEAGPNAQLSQHASLHLQIQSVPMHGELHVPAAHARQRYTGAMQFNGKRDQNPITAAFVSAGTFVGSGPWRARLRTAGVSPPAPSGRRAWIVHARMLALVRNGSEPAPDSGGVVR